MSQITIKDLTFSYPDADTASLKNINLEIEQGEFVLVCGKSGCGKTTLLRSIKNTIAPFGEKKGVVLLDDVEVEKVPIEKEAQRIGFVFQQPAHQIVTDKVWHELAFGLENLGMKSEEIRLRVAEVADYFEFTDKMQADVEKLSGGQKQLLNIASIMVMQPEVVVLDEPTAQLDPIAADHLLSTIQKINTDFGTTIIMSEHRLGGVLPMADKMVVMENGEIVKCGNPRKVAMGLIGTDFFEAMPESVKIYANFEQDYTKCPLTVGEARRWLSNYSHKEKVYDKFGNVEGSSWADIEITDRKQDNGLDSGRKGNKENRKNESNESNNSNESNKRNNVNKAIRCKDIWFRYEKNGEDVVKDLSINVDKKEILGIVGGNGAGKSTLLSLMCGLTKPNRGKVLIDGRVAMLVQDVTCLFLKDTVKEEIESTLKSLKISQDSDGDKLVSEIVGQMELENLLQMHPYDLSGGEQQRLGMAKLMLTQPEIILLDEPTKGLDENFKEFLGQLLCKWKNAGKTIVIVSHDMEFLWKYTDRCSMFFNGELVAVNETRDFFTGNRYYTTEREKIIRR